MRLCEQCGLDRDNPATHDIRTGECAYQEDHILRFMWLAETSHELYHDGRVPGMAKCAVRLPDGSIQYLSYFTRADTPDGVLVTFYTRGAVSIDPVANSLHLDIASNPYAMIDRIEIHEEPTPEQARHAGEVMAKLYELLRVVGVAPNFGDTIREEPDNLFHGLAYEEKPGALPGD